MRPAGGSPKALYHHVGVRPGYAECADRRAMRPVGMGWPVRRFRRHPHGNSVPVHVRVRFFEVQLFRNALTAHRHNHFDQSGETRRGLEVADVRLHRSDQERPVRCASSSIDRGGRLHLDRVAQRRSGAVGFQIVHFRRINARLRQRVFDHAFLRGAVGHRGTRGRAVLVDRRTPDHTPDPVSGRFRVAQPFQHDYAAAFAAHETVRPGVEGAATSCIGQHAQVRHARSQIGGQHRIHAARKGHVHFSETEAGHGLVNGEQRGGAVQFQGYRGTFQTQQEGYPAHCEAPVGTQVIDSVSTVHHQIAVLAGRNARVHACTRTPEPIGIDSRVIQRVPTRLQQEPLLRIHAARFQWRYPEESGIEPVNALYESRAAPAFVALVRPVWRYIRRSGVATGIRHGIRTIFQHAPVGVQVRCAGKATGHAYDGNTFVAGPRHGLLSGPGGRLGRGGGFTPGAVSGFHTAAIQFRVADLVDQVRYDRRDIRIVENQGVGRRIAARKRPIHPVPKFHRHERIHAQVEETDVRGRRRRQTQYRLNFLLQERQDQVLPLRRRGLPQPGEQFFGQAWFVVAAGIEGRQDLTQQGRAAIAGLVEHGPVPGQHHAGRPILSQKPFERQETLLWRDPFDPGRFDPLGDAFPLFLGFTDLGPGAPGDGLSRQAQRAPVHGELIEKGVGGSVIGLPRVSKYPRYAREQDEHVQVALLGRPVQMPGPERLRPHHALETLPTLVTDRAVRQRAHAVYHADKGRQFAVDPLEHRVNRGWVRQVREFDPHRDTAVLKRGNRLPGGRVGGAPAVQHDGPRPVVRKPLCHRASDTAQPAGNQVGAIPPQPAFPEGRRGQDDLADVPRAAHERHGGSRFGQRPHGVDQRLQLSRLKPAHHLPQGGSRPCGMLYLQDIQFQDGVGHVRTRLGHLFVAQNVPAGQLHEAAPLCETGKARFDEPLSGQAVHHDVHARASGNFEDFLSEGRLAAVEDVFHAQRPQVLPFRCARGREDFRPGGPGQLDGRQTHAARTGVNQYPVAGFQPGKFEGKGRRNEHLGHGRQGGGRQLRWRGRNQFLQGDGLRTHGAERQADHAVTGRDRGYPGTHLPDPTAELRAEMSSPHQADRAENIQEIQSAYVDRNADFTGFQGWRRSGLGM